MELVSWWIFAAVCYEATADGISPKLDFSDDRVVVASNTSESSQTDGDVEVQHTIVVSTKLKNRGLHSAPDVLKEYLGRRDCIPHFVEPLAANIRTASKERATDLLYYNVRLIRPPMRRQNDKRSWNHESGEVPVVSGYLALESTQIRSPDTRTKSAIPLSYNNRNPDSVVVSYNINPDGNDVYPENAADPRHWKPSTFYNNINNYKSADVDRVVTYNLPSNNYNRHKRPQKPTFSRRISEEGLKEYYCCKCRELQESSTSPKPKMYPWHYETTTKVKLDGKLAKLD